MLVFIFLINSMPILEKRGRRVQPKTDFLASLGLDGEALWNAVNNALDPGLAESDLSVAQRDAMLRYKETAMQEIFAQSISKREVSIDAYFLAAVYWFGLVLLQNNFLCIGNAATAPSGRWCSSRGHQKALWYSCTYLFIYNLFCSTTLFFLSIELPLTLWNPTDEMLDLLQEGSVAQFSRLQVCVYRAPVILLKLVSNNINLGFHYSAN